MKKIFLYLLTLGLLCAVVILVILARKKEEQETRVSERVQQPPDFPLLDLKGATHRISSLAAGFPLLLIYFNSTCEVCQLELKSLGDRVEEFKDARIILITAEERSEVDSFFEEHPLIKHEFVKVLLDREMKVSEYYGVRSVPEMYCYTSSGALNGSFKGMVKMDVLLEKLGIKASSEIEKKEINSNLDK